MPARISFRASSFLWMDAQRCEELYAWIHEFRETIDEIAFFTGFTHPPLPLATIQERAKILTEIIPRFKALGLATGINHLATIGHTDENLTNSLNEPWQHLVNFDGAVSASCYCATDPRMRDYITESYITLALAGPEFIWIDDDVRLEFHPPTIKFGCFCQRCLANFTAQTGTSWTRESLYTAFNTGTWGEQLALRKTWLEHNRRYIADIMALIRTAVDTVSPVLPLGLMSGEIAYSGYDYARWASALAGSRNLPVKWRPGSGFYTDERPGDALVKAHGIGRQTALLPQFMSDVQYEHENFPYQPLRKSCTIFTAEIAAAIAAGCTGAALNCMGISADPLGEYRSYFTAVQAQREFYDYAVDTFQRTTCEGIWPAFSQDRNAAMQPDGAWLSGGWGGSEFSKYCELSEIGLPTAYALEGATVAILSGETCQEYSREQLLEFLAGGVLMDGQALQYINELGLSEYTGFAIRERKDLDTTEVFTDDAINGPYAGWRRDCRPSFWPEPGYLLEPLTPKSRVLAESIDFTPTVLGPSSGVYENSLGGRVATLGYYPWRSIQSLAKTMQLRSLCRWLSHDRLPAYVASYHKAALWCRRDTQGRPAMLLINASLDTADELNLQVRDTFAALNIRRVDGLEHALMPADNDGVYQTFSLPSLAPWEPVVITVM